MGVNNPTVTALLSQPKTRTAVMLAHLVSELPEGATGQDILPTARNLSNNNYRISTKVASLVMNLLPDDMECERIFLRLQELNRPSLPQGLDIPSLPQGLDISPLRSDLILAAELLSDMYAVQEMVNMKLIPGPRGLKGRDGKDGKDGPVGMMGPQGLPGFSR